jgi:acyl-CoA synthetase (AMP-forming)/AMP-acid ligase II
MYGQTEATARLSYLPPERATDKPGSIGIAIPGVELRVVDEAGADVPSGVVGELVARGPSVTSGYLDDPEGTAAILRDGWLWTGDLVERDPDGFLYHRGRVRNMLKVGGHRVDPTEIEHVIVQHDHVDEAVVIGTPDELLGEVPVVVVVPHPGVDLDAAEMLRGWRDALPARLVPRNVIVTDSLPRNPAGKPLRAEISRLYGET